ncbi:3-oxosteroid 1-dehydrogenase [Nocardia sp. CDC153]|uniref:3-oxosteroid 1-dehydrogenase n=1 Tax=Nocardia sp. CDC153 TaxID=3112167 RepID=UPI002DB88DB1|nr:3-oxosteroid 1-dehydrogenase [Nocardia sp. CDC153]MEC3953184.1 3-oxosteroid 1-dehydrogenase [Nocardia sp. CDC153]
MASPTQHTRRQVLGGAIAGLVGVTIAPHLAHAADPAYDVVVVGCGAAGMTAALTAAKRGLSVLVVEKAAVFGGSAARSGAGIWLPNNSVILAAGVPDTPAKAAAYLDAVVGSDVAADRKAAFLTNGPKMLDFVMANSPSKFIWMDGYSDYYPELTGGMPNGRSIEPDLFDGNLLGSELANLNPSYIPTPKGVTIFSQEYKWLAISAVNAKGAAVATKTVARYTEAVAAGKVPLTMGQALAGGLRAGLLQAKVPVWLNTPLSALLHDGSGKVTGVTVTQNGNSVNLTANRGVILCSGGFEHNLSMRTKYQQAPIGTDWTVGAAANTGDGILAGIAAGAQVSLMDDSWWGPAIPLPNEPYFCLAERTLPGTIIVNQAGNRFVNEAAPYSDVVHVMYKQNPANPDIPCWLIFDQNYRDKYLFRDVSPTLPFPDTWYSSGAVKKADTWNALAAAIGVDAGNFSKTLTKFNTMALAGKDTDFKRGDSVYDHYYTDPGVFPNSCLAPLLLPPFYACKIEPGDLGTKGGLLTDASARVLNAAGAVIPGLFAAGNCSSAVMGHSYAGAGSTIGPAMTFGYVAANTL